MTWFRSSVSQDPQRGTRQHRGTTAGVGRCPQEPTSRPALSDQRSRPCIWRPEEEALYCIASPPGSELLSSGLGPQQP